MKPSQRMALRARDAARRAAVHPAVTDEPVSPTFANRADLFLAAMRHFRQQPCAESPRRVRVHVPAALAAASTKAPGRRLPR
jgi:hypothetical protein